MKKKEVEDKVFRKRTFLALLLMISLVIPPKLALLQKDKSIYNNLSTFSGNAKSSFDDYLSLDERSAAKACIFNAGFLYLVSCWPYYFILNNKRRSVGELPKSGQTIALEKEYKQYDLSKKECLTKRDWKSKDCRFFIENSPEMKKDLLVEIINSLKEDFLNYSCEEQLKVTEHLESHFKAVVPNRIPKDYRKLFNDVYKKSCYLDHCSRSCRNYRTVDIQGKRSKGIYPITLIYLQSLYPNNKKYNRLIADRLGNLYLYYSWDKLNDIDYLYEKIKSNIPIDLKNKFVLRKEHLEKYHAQAMKESVMKQKSINPAYGDYNKP